jgi:hypothetical protein
MTLISPSTVSTLSSSYSTSSSKDATEAASPEIVA